MDRHEKLAEMVDMHEDPAKGSLDSMETMHPTTHIDIPVTPPVTPPASAGASLSGVTLEGESRDASFDKDLEKGEPVEQVARQPIAQTQLSKAWGTPFQQKVRYSWISSYRKLFAVIFAANLIAFVVLCATSPIGRPKIQSVGTGASVNLMVAVLFRQENFLNVLYEIISAAPHSLPIWIRKRLAKVFHYGGVHSGCGTAAVVWYFLYTALSTVDFVQNLDGQRTDLLANMICSWVLVTMFFIILGGAHPTFRVKYHDYFEVFHRFAGWTALVTFWIHNVFAAGVYAVEENTTIGLALIRTPSFWTILVSTMCTVLSWSRLRHRKVYPEKLSDHATRLHFKYQGMQSFYGVKLSDKPLTEWHAFATIPDVDEATGKTTGFSVVVSNAGDWTNKQIMNDQERKLWIRGMPLHGLLYTSKLFKRIVVVATGSGIGPCLSLMHANVTPHRIYWSTRDPLLNYGANIVKAVKKADPNAVIWNTSTQGRGTIVQSVYNLVKECDAEAVFIISNPKVTDMVVLGMLSRGIPAYGAIFDS